MSRPVPFHPESATYAAVSLPIRPEISRRIPTKPSAWRQQLDLMDMTQNVSDEALNSSVHGRVEAKFPLSPVALDSYALTGNNKWPQRRSLVCDETGWFMPLARKPQRFLFRRSGDGCPWTTL